MKLIINMLLLTLAGMCLSLNSLAANNADDEFFEGPDAVRCVSLSRINSMRVHDNQRLSFELSGKKLYLNVLPRACPGLRKDSTIMYRTSLSQLCDLDIITVLDNRGGGYMPGASCGLGKFLPVSRETLKLLLQEPVQMQE